jgi:uncharacterized protein
MSGETLRVWCVSDGRVGIARQCQAVCAALGEQTPVARTDIILQPRPPQVWLPPNLWPAPLRALPDDQRALLMPPWPDVWIANGRRSIAYSLWVMSQRAGGKRPLVVQLQNPRLATSRFDLVVPPRHDGVTGGNVVATFGAPVWYSSAQIKTAIEQHRVAAANKSVLVVLGGNSKRHRFEPARAYEIIYDLKKLRQKGFQLLITASRRTPNVVIARLREFVRSAPDVRFFANEAEDGPNPYLAWLAQADCALVTEDSTNMITDAAFFGLPVHLVRLEGGDARFNRLHSNMIDAGIARWFSGDVMDWSYEPIRDAQNVAQVILERVS